MKLTIKNLDRGLKLVIFGNVNIKVQKINGDWCPINGGGSQFEGLGRTIPEMKARLKFMATNYSNKGWFDATGQEPVVL